MDITHTKIQGVNVIHFPPYQDERGFFNRVFDMKLLGGIVIEQINHSMTRKKGTVRGVHFQYPPHAEMKIVRCIKGGIFDVVVDLRKNSPTFLQWHGEILSAENMNSLVTPEGCAHGFQALDDNIEMLYLHTKAYCKEAEETVHFDDPKVGIKWQLPITYISEKDNAAKFLTEDWKGIEL
jgi:dTDP-4-dehydrorhamnose 3,5-epimerase